VTANLRNSDGPSRQTSIPGFNITVIRGQLAASSASSNPMERRHKNQQPWHGTSRQRVFAFALDDSKPAFVDVGGGACVAPHGLGDPEGILNTMERAKAYISAPCLFSPAAKFKLRHCIISVGPSLPGSTADLPSGPGNRDNQKTQEAQAPIATHSSLRCIVEPSVPPAPGLKSLGPNSRLPKAAGDRDPGPAAMTRT
jgi:hypothetical protein